MLAVLVVVVMGTQLPKDLVVARLTPDVVLIALVWVTVLMLTQRAGGCPGPTAVRRPTASPNRVALPKTRSAEATRKGDQHHPASS